MAIYDRFGNQLSVAYDRHGNPVEKAYDRHGSLVFQSKPSLKVMSYNVQYWNNTNSVVSTQNIAFGDGADIVGIQEWGASADRTIGGQSCIEYLNGFGYETVWVSSLNYNHTAIASKLELSDRSEVVYSTFHERRSYTKSYFTFEGKRIALFNTHLDPEEDEVMYTQASEILNAVKSETYFILIGDFNVGSKTKEGTSFQRVVQPFIDEGFNVANSMPNEDLIWTFYNGKTVADSTSITPPDNIITSANISIDNVYTIDTKLHISNSSGIDHIPLVAVLTLEDTVI